MLTARFQGSCATPRRRVIVSSAGQRRVQRKLGVVVGQWQGTEGTAGSHDTDKGKEPLSLHNMEALSTNDTAGSSDLGHSIAATVNVSRS